MKQSLEQAAVNALPFVSRCDGHFSSPLHSAHLDIWSPVKVLLFWDLGIL